MSDRFYDGEFYNRQITLNYLETNTDKKVFIHTLLGEYSELAGDECEVKGQNHSFFINSGVVFMISRMSLRFHRIPVQGETLLFTTWFRGAEGKFFFRDCEVRGEDGELLASMEGTWVLLDLVSHEMLGADRYPGNGSTPYPQKLADVPECKKILPMPDMTRLGERPVYYTDLDCNCHMNNAVYSRIAADFLPAQYRQRDIADYVINFNRETRLGQTMEIFGGPTENGYVIIGYCDGVRHFASEFTFKN